MQSLYASLDTFYASLPLPVRGKLKKGMMAILKFRLKQFYSQFIKPGHLVYDVGGNEGDYTEVFHSLGSTVICIEPHPLYIAKLQQKFANHKNIHILPKGIGEKNGVLDFYISSFNSPNSSFSKEFRTQSRYHYRQWDRIVKVPVVTIDKLIKKYGTPDFCKIDVEGYEWEVLSTLRKPLPILSFEFLSEMYKKTNKIIRFLDTLQESRYNLCLGMSYTYLLPRWVNADDMLAFLKTNQNKRWSGDIYVTSTVA